MCADPSQDAEAWYSTIPKERVRAMQLCGQCPVAVQCLAAALEGRERFGVWGGVDLESPTRAFRAQYTQGWRRT